MHRFRSVLFSPLGDSDNAAAVRRVAGLAHQNKAQLTLFGVLPEPSGLQRVLHPREFFNDVRETDRRAMEKRLGRLAPKNRDGQIEIAIETGVFHLVVDGPVKAEHRESTGRPADPNDGQHHGVRKGAAIYGHLDDHLESGGDLMVANDWGLGSGVLGDREPVINSIEPGLD